MLVQFQNFPCGDRFVEIDSSQSVPISVPNLECFKSKGRILYYANTGDLIVVDFISHWSVWLPFNSNEIKNEKKNRLIRTVCAIVILIRSQSIKEAARERGKLNATLIAKKTLHAYSNELWRLKNTRTHSGLLKINKKLDDCFGTCVYKIVASAQLFTALRQLGFWFLLCVCVSAILYSSALLCRYVCACSDFSYFSDFKIQSTEFRFFLRFIRSFYLHFNWQSKLGTCTFHTVCMFYVCFCLWCVHFECGSCSILLHHNDIDDKMPLCFCMCEIQCTKLHDEIEMTSSDTFYD